MAGILLRSMLSVALVAGALAGISTSAAQAQTAARLWAAADFLGGAQPLPPVPRGAGFPAARRKRPRPQRAGFGAGAGDPERRPRLGAQHREPALYRSRRPRQRALHPRQRQGKLSDADRSSDRDPPDRPGAGRRHLRLDGRRWRRPANVHLRLCRAGQSQGPLRPHHGGHRRRVQLGRQSARVHRDRGARHLHRRPRRQCRFRRGKSGPADCAVR